MIDKPLAILRKININGAIVYALTLAWIFTIVYGLTDKARLIAIMNSLLFGAMLTLFINYAKYIAYAISSPEAWTRARQFGLSSGILWGSVVVLVAASIQRHSTASYPINATVTMDIISRYLGIIAATMQVFAPDFGKNLLYGSSRKTFIISCAAGVLSAMLLAYLQADNFLDW